MGPSERSHGTCEAVSAIPERGETNRTAPRRQAATLTPEPRRAGPAHWAAAEAVGAGVHAHSLVSLRVVLASSLNGQHRYEEARRILQGIRPGHWHPAWTVGIQVQLAAAELGLGMPGEAEARAREAATEAERISGPAHYTTLRAGTLLGSAIARQGRHDEAGHQLQANAEAWLEHFGEDHPRTVAAYQELARAGHDAT